ncbi:MAG TPA: helix-turn-helix transcriptional regulator [Pyrinomonadaceae bacterium]|jgi:transcriptional regulator with XRE-family HTH domain|nr:helix-turn-helix transcriptional regulator [Pyrinomonadaceae bacterium]
MGYARPRPKRLSEKLRQIRLALALSQSEMHRRLETGEQIPFKRISDYELDKNEPSLMTVLAYARAAGVLVEDIIDDELDLPAKLPGNVKYRGLRRPSRSLSKC